PVIGIGGRVAFFVQVDVVASLRLVLHIAVAEPFLRLFRAENAGAADSRGLGQLALVDGLDLLVVAVRVSADVCTRVRILVGGVGGGLRAVLAARDPRNKLLVGLRERRALKLAHPVAFDNLFYLPERRLFEPLLTEAAVILLPELLAHLGAR